MEIILLWKLFLFFAKDFLNCETKADKVCLTNAISYKREEGAHPIFQYKTKKYMFNERQYCSDTGINRGLHAIGLI